MEILIPIVLAPVVNFFVQKGKNKLGLEGKVSLVIVSIIVGLIYVVFQRLAPEALQANASEFVGQTFTYAVLIYEFIIKNFLPKDK